MIQIIVPKLYLIKSKKFKLVRLQWARKSILRKSQQASFSEMKFEDAK